MIQLTRLNNHPLLVNSDLIKFVENAPDTVITLLTGEKIVVRETVAEILERFVMFRQRVLGIADSAFCPLLLNPSTAALFTAAETKTQEEESRG